MTECMNDKCPAIQDVIGTRYDGTRIAQGINEASGHDVAAVTASTAKKAVVDTINENQSTQDAATIRNSSAPPLVPSFVWTAKLSSVAGPERVTSRRNPRHGPSAMSCSRLAQRCTLRPMEGSRMSCQCERGARADRFCSRKNSRSDARSKGYLKGKYAPENGERSMKLRWTISSI